MGCTSSAPNMASPQSDSEKKLKFSHESSETSMEEKDEVIYADKENETNAINVLPSCDNLGGPTQLARNNKSFIDTSSLDLEKGFHANDNGHDTESEDKVTTKNDIDNSNTIQAEDKMSTLEEVVEKVVELYVADSMVAISQNETNNAKDTKDNTIRKINADMAIENMQNSNTEPTEQKEETPEEIASPSQSESSRATRWEALADIAAELPPTLTVDPITGQIYALK